MVTVTAARAAAVQVVWKTLADIIGDDRYRAEEVVDALARAGLLVDPQRVAALEEVAEAAEALWSADGPTAEGRAFHAMRAALDAVPAASTTSGE